MKGCIRSAGRLVVCVSVAVTVVACDSPTGEGPVRRIAPTGGLALSVGTPVNYDVTRGGTIFSRAAELTYAVTAVPEGTGLSVSGTHLVGNPSAPGAWAVVVKATDASAHVAADTFPVVAFAAGLKTPNLTESYSYVDSPSSFPQHFLVGGASVVSTSNTPPFNLTSDAGATLGRVLFYDTRLSGNDAVACASCHLQQFGFSDTARVSQGFNGATVRHSPSLTNARFYLRGRFFWDERASSLETQVLEPVADPIEMGLSEQGLLTKLSLTPYYPPLFEKAFGTRDITSERVRRALAQFIRSLTSANSRFDSAFVAGAFTPTRLTAQELQGFNLFNASGCAGCHQTNAQVSDAPHNNGLDAQFTDAGLGRGQFKSPSLRNVAVRGRYMHDGRFTSLEQVVEFYDVGVQNGPDLDGRMRGPNGPRRLNLGTAGRAALVAYLKTLTDNEILTAKKFSDPFAQ